MARYIEVHGISRFIYHTIYTFGGSLPCPLYRGSRYIEARYIEVLLYSISDIQSYLDDNKHVIGIYIDLSKAFDTIDHAKLLTKLDNCGIRGNTHSLLKGGGST